MAQKTYTIPGMHCNHCVHTIKMELGELPGLQSIDVNLSSKQVMVIFEPPATSEQIEDLLKEINYPILKDDQS